MGVSSIRCVGITDPTALEVIACREALPLAQDLSLTHVIIASDSQEVVTNIKPMQEAFMAAS
jgi:ribonuclease HI